MIEQRLAEAPSPQWGHIELARLTRREDEATAEPADPYEFMIHQDRWMINLPADQACLDYVTGFIEKRQAYGQAMVVLYATAILPGFGLVILAAGAVARWFWRRK